VCVCVCVCKKERDERFYNEIAARSIENIMRCGNTIKNTSGVHRCAPL
jgi:hypothetical protein